MAGSNNWMIYTTDDGEQYAVNIAESNGLATDFDDYTGTPALPPLPQGYVMRSVQVVESDTGLTRSLPVGKPDGPVWLDALGALLLGWFSAQAPGFGAAVAFLISSYTGEKRRGRPNGFDTGLDDDYLGGNPGGAA